VTGLLDVHSHLVPDWYVDLAVAHGHDVPDGMPAWPAWSAANHLAFMDERGIERSLLSLSSPGVALGPGVDLPALARRVNDHAADVAAAYPDRLGRLASLPLPDVDASLAELDRALDELGADGVVLATHALGTYVTDSSHEPLWAALAERGCVVLLHPTSPPGWELTSPDLPRPMLEFVFETTRVVIGLAVGGVLTRHPGLRLVVPHSGSVVPFLADRAALFQLGGRLLLPPDDPAHQVPLVPDALGGLWWDLAGTPTTAHVGALVDRCGTGRLVYGSDFCFTPPVAVDLQLGLLDRVAEEAGLGDWRNLTRANADRLTRR
jgi:6-methylsalicylate decarboxylase